MSNLTKIRIGIAGWDYPDWKGIVYPAGKVDHLAFVAQFVDVIEINSTFYRPANALDSKSWLTRTKNSGNLMFTAKLHRSFTHDGVIDSAFAADFITGLEPMLTAGKLNHLLMQFSFAFEASKDNRGYLTQLAKLFGRDFNLIVEVRNRSWQQPEALKFLSEMGISLCNPDYAVAKDSFYLPDSVIGRTGYMRLHGRNAEAWFDSEASRDDKYDYYYNTEELKTILSRVERLAGQCGNFLVIANNHYKGAQMANALELKYLLTGSKQSVPEGLLSRYPNLNEIASNPGLF